MNCVQQIGTLLCRSPLFLDRATGKHTNTHRCIHTHPIHPIYLNTTPFLCHVDFLLVLTLKSGHHIYSTGCMAANMTKPLHSQQRCASVKSEQWFEWNHHGSPIQTNASRNKAGISVASLIKTHSANVGCNVQKLWFSMRLEMFFYVCFPTKGFQIPTYFL